MTSVAFVAQVGQHVVVSTAPALRGIEQAGQA